jgi:hypothetical protein
VVFSKLKATFDLPASFDPAEFLSGRLTRQAHGARWRKETAHTRGPCCPGPSRGGCQPGRRERSR